MPHRRILVFLLLNGIILLACRIGDAETPTATAGSLIDISGITQLQLDLSGIMTRHFSINELLFGNRIKLCILLVITPLGNTGFIY